MEFLSLMFEDTNNDPQIYQNYTLSFKFTLIISNLWHENLSNIFLCWSRSKLYRLASYSRKSYAALLFNLLFHTCRLPELKIQWLLLILFQEICTSLRRRWAPHPCWCPSTPTRRCFLHWGLGQHVQCPSWSKFIAVSKFGFVVQNFILYVYFIHTHTCTHTVAI